MFDFLANLLGLNLAFPMYGLSSSSPSPNYKKQEIISKLREKPTMSLTKIRTADKHLWYWNY